MKKFVVSLVLAITVMGAFASVSEARCGQRGGRMRAWFQNHRPHLFHRNGCN